MKKPEEVLLDAELEIAENKLRDFQQQLDNLLKAGDAYMDEYTLPMRFYARVNSGELVKSFSQTATDMFMHVKNMKEAVRIYEEKLAKEAGGENGNGN